MTTIEVFHTKYTDAEAVAAVEAACPGIDLSGTLDVAGLSTMSVSGVALDIQNTTDGCGAQSLQIAILRGPDRACPFGQDGDEYYTSYLADNDVGTQVEIVRETFVLTDASNGSECSRYHIDLVQQGSLLEMLAINGSIINKEVVVNDGSIDVDFRAEGSCQTHLLAVNAGLDVVSIGGVAVAGKILSIYGDLLFPSAASITTGGCDQDLEIAASGQINITGNISVSGTTRLTGNVGIGNTATCLDNLTVFGTSLFTHTATEADDHNIEIEHDAAGFGDSKALDFNYITGIIAAGEEAEVILINVDQSATTGGEVDLIVGLATEGSANVTMLEVGGLINPILQLSGTFTNMRAATFTTAGGCPADARPGFISPCTNLTLFPCDNDFITVADCAKFEEIEFLLATVASGPGIKPTFEYSTGCGTWAGFVPIDGTNGMRNTGVVLWDAATIPCWVAGACCDFHIRVTRTQNAVTTDPVECKVQIAAVTEYSWDKCGDVSIRALNVAGAYVFNEAGSDIDGRFEGVCNPNLLVLDGGLDVVSIGGAAVSGKMLSVYGTLHFPCAATIDSGGGITLNPTGDVTVSGGMVINDTAGVALTVNHGNTSLGKWVNSATSGITAGAGFLMYSADGAAMGSGHRLGFMVFGGSIDSCCNLDNAAAITAFAPSAWGACDHPSDIRFETTVDGSTTRSEKVRITCAGGLSFAQASLIQATSGDLSFGAAGNEIIMIDQLVLKITDVDGAVEGSIWYDASEDKLKFKTAAGVETITSA